MKKILLLTVFLNLIGCATRKIPAPIINVTSVPKYIKQHDNTNENNHENIATLDDNNKVTVTINKSESNSTANKLIKNDNKWLLPTQGKVVKSFSNNTKGIDFSGNVGQDIIAVSDGKILYSGVAKGYGNLIIIKHDKEFLTAYALNQQNYVKSGDVVHKGQKIASMGGNSKGLLHFELRINGKPIDPATKINLTY
jgi:murein DD-endopeptidase MepM/ murein hydrolase activator NlpD